MQNTVGSFAKLFASIQPCEISVRLLPAGRDCSQYATIRGRVSSNCRLLDSTHAMIAAVGVSAHRPTTVHAQGRRFCALARIATLSRREFCAQKRSNNTSGVPGVHFLKRPRQPPGLWQARIKLPDVVERMHGAGMEIMGGTVQEFAAYDRSEFDKWTTFIKNTGIKLQ